MACQCVGHAFSISVKSLALRKVMGSREIWHQSDVLVVQDKMRWSVALSRCTYMAICLANRGKFQFFLLQSLSLSLSGPAS